MDSVITWHELYTSDVDAATTFYTELLGLELESADMGDFEYPMLRKDGRSHAGFFKKEHEEIPSHWYPYALVDDVDGTIEKAKSLGAELHSGPIDVGDGLRVAVLGDAQRATFGVMQWDQEPPTGVFVWDELHATDVDAAASFYGDLVGWTTAPFMEGYQAFNAGETGVAGLMQERAGSPVASWLTYFGVDDTDATAAKAMELGAGVVVPPESMEGVGRYAVLTDPTGATFGIHHPSS
ncbi:MAG TPA: VOC family protein [Gaiellaceae bacterium]|jgi:predicted enzyme related to lactoylglutathione lyase